MHFSLEVGELILLIFDFIVLMFCESGLHLLDILLQLGNVLQLLVLFLSIFFFKFFSFLNTFELVHHCLFDDVIDELFQFENLQI